MLRTEVMRTDRAANPQTEHLEIGGFDLVLGRPPGSLPLLLLLLLRTVVITNITISYQH